MKYEEAKRYTIYKFMTYDTKTELSGMHSIMQEHFFVISSSSGGSIHINLLRKIKIWG